MLTNSQVQAFQDDGFLVVGDVLDQQNVLDPVRREYACMMDQLYDGWHRQGKVPAPQGMGFWEKLLLSYELGCDWFQPMDISLPNGSIAPDTPFHIGQAVLDMMTAPDLLDVVQALIGPEITSNPIQHVRLKPPAANLRDDEARGHIAATEWHQDQGVTHESADNTTMITVWIAVTDATLDNGCLMVQPGAHKGQLLPHCDKTQVAIPDDFIDAKAARPLPVKSGGIVIFHPMVPHASMVNRTDRFRWSFDIRYNVTGQPTGRDHFPNFVARSRKNPNTELRNANQWRAMWEKARNDLSARPEVPLYRWDTSAPYCA